jgi:class 3 adenylate cyclase
MPSEIVTFLFTDIEGSTRRWEDDPDAMRSALEAHDEVLRAAITGCGGSLFKHTGDGACAVFSSPKGAVEAAVAAQRALELPVRMGVATGEAEPRDADYFGAVLNRASRVMSAGHYQSGGPRGRTRGNGNRSQGASASDLDRRRRGRQDATRSRGGGAFDERLRST